MPVWNVFVAQSKVARGVEVFGRAVNFKFTTRLERVFEPFLDERNGEVRDVYADPFAFEFLRGVNGCAAAAEWIKNHVTFIAAGFDDALQKRERLLRGIAERLRAGRNFDVVPKITDRNSFLFVKITLESGNSLTAEHNDQTLCAGFEHPAFCPADFDRAALNS